MKTKAYRNGKLTARSYLKDAGHGWEVGFDFQARALFVGNFIHAAEARAWFTLMNREVRAFAKRYKVSAKFPKSAYSRLLESHLHNKYYAFLDRLLTKHNRTWRKAAARDLKLFRRAERHVPRGLNRMPLLKAA